MSTKSWAFACMFVVAIGARSSAPAVAQTSTEGFVTFEKGDLPILLTAPHGGSQQPTNVLERTLPGARKGTDSRTKDLTLAMADALESVLGGRPYVVIADFHRKYIDANRDDTFDPADDDSLATNEAYNDEDARVVYQAYHGKIREFIDDIHARFDVQGVLIDVHGQDHAPGTIERGTKDGKTCCGLIPPDGDDGALTGPFSIFGQLQSLGYTVFPPPSQPLGDPSESLSKALNGGPTVVNYGSCTADTPPADGLHCIQIESGTFFRRSSTLDTYAQALANALGVFFEHFIDPSASATLLDVARQDDLPTLTDVGSGRLGAGLATGDFDHDGLADVAAGRPGRGSVRVFYGHRVGLTGPVNEDVSEADVGATFEAGDEFGSALAAGDFNGDGIDDLAIGSPGTDDAASHDGMVCVVYGADGGFRNGSDTFVAEVERLSQTDVDAHGESGDRFGSSLAVGDFNGNGVTDLAVGVPGENDAGEDDGMVVVFYGSIAHGLLREVGGEQRAVSFERLAQHQAGATDESGDAFGSSLAVGDFNANGIDDLAIGVPGEDDAASDEGIVVVFYGSPDGLIRSVDGAFHAVSFERLAQKHVEARQEAGDHFGAALVAGDFDGDGADDLAVGVPDEFDQADHDGMVVVFYGSASSGLLHAVDGEQRAVRFERLSQRHAGATNEAGDRFGATLCTGDFNGDGVGDLVVGVPGENDRASDDGMVVEFSGSTAHGLLHQADGVMKAVASRRISQVTLAFASEADDRFGAAIAAGDFNGDGFADLAVGAPGEDIAGTVDSGTLYQRKGKASGL